MSAAGAIALHNALTPPPKSRLSAKSREAIRLMVEDALPRAEAAAKAGITDFSLYRVLRTPTGIAHRDELFEVLRTSAASRSLARVDRLADGSTSETVKLESNKLLLGLAGHVVTNKSESVSTHKHLLAGLVVIRGPEPVIDEPARVIDGQARQVQSRKAINRIGQPVPHPSMRNATIHAPEQEILAGESEGQP